MKSLMGIRENRALRTVIGTIVMAWKVSWREGETPGKAEVVASFLLTIMHL